MILRFCHIAAKVIFNSVNSGVTGLNVTKFLNNFSEMFMPFNLLKSVLRYCSPFWNDNTLILRQKLSWQRLLMDHSDIPC